MLVVEDDTILRKHLVRLFLREGYRVSAAASHATARQHLAEGAFDILLLDVKLPDGNGLDLLAALDGSPRPRLILVMTAFSTAEHEQLAQSLDVTRLLRKPVDLLQLLDSVRAADGEPTPTSAARGREASLTSS